MCTLPLIRYIFLLIKNGRSIQLQSGITPGHLRRYLYPVRLQQTFQGPRHILPHAYDPQEGSYQVCQAGSLSIYLCDTALGAQVFAGWKNV